LKILNTCDVKIDKNYRHQAGLPITFVCEEVETTYASNTDKQALIKN